MASLIGTDIGEYRVIAPLGVGAIGAVYLAEAPLLGQRVAIKVLHADLATNGTAVTRCFADARAAARLESPAIARILECSRDERLAYVVMEHLAARTLAELIDTGPVPIAQALDIADQIAAVLESAHGGGLIHGALKAENVFVFERFRGIYDVRVVDFGMVHLAVLHGGRATSAYLAPEQCAGSAPDGRSDIYALGVLIFEMLTGRLPFPGAQDAMIMGHLMRPAPRLAEAGCCGGRGAETAPGPFPASVDAVVATLLAKARRQRFQTMAEVRAALADPRGHLESLSLPRVPSDSIVAVPSSAADAAPAPAPAVPPSRVQRRLGRAVAALFGLVLAALVLRSPAEHVVAIAPLGVALTQTVTIAIDSRGLPCTARVSLDGVDLGSPSWGLTLERSTVSKLLSIRAPGYLPYSTRITPLRDSLIEPVLVPRPPTPSFL